MTPEIPWIWEGMEMRGHVGSTSNLPLVFLVLGSVGMVYGEKWIRRKTRLP